MLEGRHPRQRILAVPWPRRSAQIQVSHSDRDALEAIVEQLLQERLIACGQVLGPVSSSFRWEGEVQREQEWLALLKTATALADPVRARVAELHPYEVPEIIVTRGARRARAVPAMGAARRRPRVWTSASGG